MKIIEKLSDMIEEELGDAEKYVRCAITYQSERPALADIFYTLSIEEMKHMQMLHGQVVSIIDEYKKSHGDIPEGMKTLYEYLHSKHMERASEIKAMQAAYKDKG